MQQRIRDSFARQGLMQHIGATLGEIAPGRITIVLPRRSEVAQQNGFIHAGALGAIADSAGGYAALTLFPEESDVLGVEYKMNFVSPGVGTVEAVGTVVKSGRTLTVCNLEVFDLDNNRKLVALGQQTLIRVAVAA
ncbi:PaaI family thioesterase [soil metagenome]